MTTDADDALSWEGDEDQPARPSARREKPVLPDGWAAVGKDSETVGRLDEDDDRVRAEVDVQEPASISTPLLVFLGVIGGVYLLYTIGWISSAAKLGPNVFLAGVAGEFGIALWAAAAAPALWFAASWALTRSSRTWVRVSALLAGVLLLVPWPFVMTGVAS
ncbi:hypothetical protein [Microbacterium sp. GXF6406]